MGIGLGLLRAVGRGRRVVRAEEARGRPGASVREVRLIGLDLRAPVGEWPAGREVNWLGRTYQVEATAGDGPVPVDPTTRRYIHLSARDGD